MHRLFPGDFLPGVGGHAAHDRHQRGVAHVLAVIDRLAVANRAQKSHVLIPIH